MTQVLCPVLIGRGPEMAQIEAALRGGREGNGRVLLISGEAGIGKSRLAREAEARAWQDGMRVGRGRALQGTGQAPYRPLAEALQSLLGKEGTDGGVIEQRYPVLGSLLPEWSGDRPTRPESDLVVADGVLRLLGDLAARDGLLLILEDLHWADADTLSVLEYLTDHLSDARVVCICTERSAWPNPAADRLAALVARRGVDHLALDRLTDAEVFEMARHCIDVDPVPAAVAKALAKRSEGVPFFVEEMLTAYLGLGGPRERTVEWWIPLKAAEALPPSYRDLVRERLSGLDGTAQEVVTGAAVLGRTFEWPVLTPIMSQPRTRVLEGLRAAVSAQLLIASPGTHPEAFSFRHALARETVLADLLPTERAELSLKLADAIEDLRPGVPGEWCERVADLREQGGDSVGAVRLLMESGRRALRRGALGSAEQSLVRARELAGDDYTLWLGIDELLAEVLSRAGKTERLVAVTRDLLAFFEEEIPARPGSGLRYATYLSPSRLARFHLHAARARLLAGEPDVARDYLDQVWAGRSILDEVVVADAHALAAQVSLSSSDLDRAIGEAQTSWEMSERLGTAGESACEALDALGRALWLSGDGVGATETLERMAEVATRLDLPDWMAKAFIELGTIDRETRAEAGRLLEARSLGGSIGAVSTLATAELQIGWNHLFLGRLDDARASIDAAIDTCRRFRLTVLPRALIALGAWSALSDDAPAMEGAIREALDLAAGDREIEAEVHGNCRALLWLVRDKRDLLIAELDEAADAARGTPVGKAWWAGLSVLLRSMSPDPGGPAHPSAHEFPNPTARGFALYAEAIALGRRGETAGAAGAFGEADGVMPTGWRRHRARCLAAEAAHDDGWGDPRAWVSEALANHEAMRLDRLASSARSLARRIGVPVRRKGRGASIVPAELARLGITSREMDVLALVADGLSNTLIAERLFLSARTVETHVRSLMRRTGVESRTQLVAFAVRNLGSAGPVAEPGSLESTDHPA